MLYISGYFSTITINLDTSIFLLVVSRTVTSGKWRKSRAARPVVSMSHRYGRDGRSELPKVRSPGLFNKWRKVPVLRCRPSRRSGRTLIQFNAINF